MTTARYHPPVAVHPDRVGASRSTSEISVAVLHTSEGAEGVDAARRLALFQTNPGDRTTSSGSRYGSSYHDTLDLDRWVRPCVPYDRVAYAAAGANRFGVHAVIPGTARQSRADWLDTTSLGYIETAAAWLLDVGALFSLPLRRLTDDQLAAGYRGYVDHWAVSRVFRQSDHYDPGPAFPWDALEERIAELTPALTPEDHPAMFVIDYMPNTPAWARLTLAGRLSWTQGSASHVVDRLQVPRQIVSRVELVDVIRSFGTTGPNPWDQNAPGHAPADAELFAAWETNRRN